MRWLAAAVIVLSIAPHAAAPCFALSEIHTVGQRASDDAEPPPVQREARRPRTRLRVRPIYPYRHYHSIYPVPYRFEYPGPNAKRECVARYVQEHRPSGTVIVPRVNCRWVRG